MPVRHNNIRVGLLLGVYLLLFCPWQNFHAQSLSVPDAALDRFLNTGIFDPDELSEDDLYAAVEALYAQENEPGKKSAIAEKWLLLKWWRLWEADTEMSAQYVLVGNTLPAYATPSENWQWSANSSFPHPRPAIAAEHFRRVHSSPSENGVSRHRFQGTMPSILPVNGRLLQYVYLPADQHPRMIQLSVATAPLSGTLLGSSTVNARWTPAALSVSSSENRPDRFWAGTLPTDEGWHLLTVDLADIGLCGSERILRGIEYRVDGGDVWFGPTVVRRPPVEMRGAQPYNVFEIDEPLQFGIAVHNFAAVPERYRLDATFTDYEGNIIQETVYYADIAANSTWSQSLAVSPGAARYVVCDYVLYNAGEPVYHGNTAAARIESSGTGRRDNSPFGMMYWEQPGREMVAFYEKLGVKLIGIFPELHRLHRFDPQTFSVMPMIWSLPDLDSPEAHNLRNTIQPYLQAGQRVFSNFWETDLRVPATLFAPKMQHFSAIIKAVEPSALVGIGGLAWFNVAYVDQVFRAFVPPAPIDFITAMSYTTPSPPEFSGLAREAAALKTVLQQRQSPRTELWNVEWAYFENLNVDDNVWLNTGVPRRLIAPYTIRHHLVGFGAGIDRMLPGTIIYAGRTPLAKNYGHSMTLGRSSILRYDLSPLPMLPAYATMTRLLEGTTYRNNLSLHPNVWCQVYQSSALNDASAGANGNTVLVVWSAFGHEPIALPLFPDDRDRAVTIVNMIGEERQQVTFRGRLHLSASPEPLYVLLPAGADALPLGDPVNVKDDVLFESVPDTVDILPGQTQQLTLTYRLTNPGNQELRGILRLRHPNWLTIRDSEIRYPLDTQRQLADLMLTSASNSAVADVAFWLGRGHTIDVVYAVETPATIPRATYYEQLALTQQPWFTLMADIWADNGIIAQAGTTVQSRPLLELKLRPIVATAADVNNSEIEVRITNHSAIDRSGTLEMRTASQLRILPPNAAFSVSAGDSRDYRFRLSGEDGYVREYDRDVVDARLQREREHVMLQPVEKSHLDHYRKKDGYQFSFGVGEGYVVEALLKDEQGFETRQSRGFAFRPAMRATQAVQIDGRVDEWRNAIPLFLDPDGRLAGLTFFAGDYGGEMQWTGIDDFSAAWQMMWDDDALYLAVKTWDDHIQPYSLLSDFWNGDTISFQIDPQPDTTDASILPEIRDLWAIHTFEMALGEHGPVIRRKHPTHEHPAGLLQTVRIAANQTADGILYELAIPWQELAPLSPENSDWMGFSLVFYEDDGDGREARINWFGGSGGNGLAREPRLMGDVHFSH